MAITSDHQLASEMVRDWRRLPSDIWPRFGPQQL